MEFEYILQLFIFLFGAVVGSFLNVCIYRMPLEQSVVHPTRSFCPHCKHSLPWHDNIPFLSYIFLRGRCRFCQKRITFRYFLVEAITAASFLFFYLYFGLSAVLFPYLVFISCLIVATFVDFEHRIIPDEINIGGMIIGFLFSCLIPQLHGLLPEQGLPAYGMSAFRSLLGILIGGGSIYLMGVIGDFIFKKETMGGGDVKLMALVGAFLGWKAAILAFFIAPFFGAVFGLVVKLKTGESLIPYGPFLVLGSLISLFYEQEIIAWIMGGYGLY